MTTINKFLPINFKSETMPILKIEAARDREYVLAQKAAAGDLDAFEQIYWQHHRRVFGICVRMTKNVTEAEDVTQRVFLQLFRKTGSFRGGAAFSTWLHRMTVNHMLMHFRANKSRKEQTTEDGKLPEDNFAHNKKDEDADQIVNRIELNQAVAQLPDGYRKVVILHDIQGFEHEEIARILGCAAGTSKSQLHKARRRPRRLLATGDITTQKIHEAVQ